MPNIKSAKKRMKTSAKSHMRNKGVKAELSSTRRKILSAVTAGDRGVAEATFKVYCSVLDKAAKKGSIRKTNAARRKSRIAARLASLG